MNDQIHPLRNTEFNAFGCFWGVRHRASIRQKDLIERLRRVSQIREQKGVVLRNDNVSQFITHKVRNFLKGSEVK